MRKRQSIEKRLAYHRKRRAEIENRDQRRYEKTPNGFLMRAYVNMQSRVSGRQKNKAHLYKGLELLPRADFYTWARENSEFWRLFRQWVFHDYDKKLTPSVNRLRTSEGYRLDNMEWLTHSVNSGLANRCRRNPLKPNFQELYAHTKTAVA